MADKPEVAVGEEILGVAGGVGHVLAAEHPADVRVAKATEGAPPSGRVVEVGAVRVALMVREAMVLAVGGDPLDHWPFDGHRAEHGQHRSHRARRLEAAVREQPVIADGDAQPGARVGDRENEQVLPMQGAAPRQPSSRRERGRRCREHYGPHDAIGRLVLDRDHFRSSRQAGSGTARSRGTVVAAV